MASSTEPPPTNMNRASSSLAPPPSTASFTTPTDTNTSTSPTLTIRSPTDRLSLAPALRIPLTTLISFLSGASLGVTAGGTQAGLVFRAENAHRTPTTTRGWYLYHKTKNYRVMYGAVAEGLKMGGRVAVWGGGFFLAEEAIDRLRGCKDAGSSTVAGLGIAGAFSAWNRLEAVAAARTTKLGLGLGLGFGVVQDVLALLKGQRVAYVDWVRRFVVGGRGGRGSALGD